LGVAGIRGDIVPVFSLSTFLGYGQDHEDPTWTVLCGGEHPVGLGFAELDGYLRLPKSAVHADDASQAKKHYVTDVVATESGARPVIAVPLIITDIRNWRGPQRPKKEQ
jgi:chemotaxis signal transduction protein